MLVEAATSSPWTAKSSKAWRRSTKAPMTGESAPVIRESGGDRSAVTGGTTVLSDWLVIRITAKPGRDFLDRMISMVEGAKRQKTPNEIALDILLAAHDDNFPARHGDAASFLDLSASRPQGKEPGHHHGARCAARLSHPDDDRRAALGDRHRGHGPDDPGERDRHVGPGGGGGRRRRCAAARQDRHDHARQPAGDRVHSGAGRRSRQSRRCSQLASLADETPEGRSIVVLAKEKYGSGRGTCTTSEPNSSRSRLRRE